MCTIDSTLCVTGCAENPESILQGVNMCQRNCILGGTNEFCASDCVEAPEQCQRTQSHIPFDQLPVHEERAVYIPKIYSDPILEILQQSTIPTEA